MSRHILFAAVITVVSLSAGCSDQSPVTPTAVPATGDSLLARAEKVPGIYELSLVAWIEGSFREVSTLPVAGEGAITEGLVLQARVRDASGAPAVTGTVIFESCSLQGKHAPADACNSGRGRWQRLFAMEVASANSNIPGMALHGFGNCSTPQTVGFRFRYVRGGAVADGFSNTGDLTWVAD